MSEQGNSNPQEAGSSQLHDESATQEALIRQMRWRCRRGILEVELLLQPFFEHHALTLITQRRPLFEKLLACADTDLLAWFTQDATPQESDLAAFVQEIIQFSR